MAPEILQYQNANQSFESVIDHFIVRQREFERVIDDIRNTDKDSSFQHYVFVGRRGSGKSTLLRRIQAEINIDEQLSDHYVCINIAEEKSFIYKLYDLWDYVIRELNALGYKIQDLDFRIFKDDMKAYTKELHARIIQALKANNRRLVLLLDNIDRILDTRSGGLDTALFRELLINFKEIRIIGGSTHMSEHFWKYDMPFYEFFTIKKLEPLSLQEVNKLLVHWSQVKNLPEIVEIIKNYPGKLQSIRMLTDGMPRTMLLFVDMMIDRPKQNGYTYLQVLVDRATPIYQERLGILSPAQQKVLSELAFLWDAASVEELVPLCKMEGKVVSALLKQLVDIRYVEKIKTHNKNNLYRVEERFFNLWFNMTQGGLNSRIRAKALTDFLEKWYDKSELNELCVEFSYAISQEDAKRDYIEAMSHALLGSDKISSEYKQKLHSQLSSKGLLKELDTQNEFSDDLEKITGAFDNNDYEKAITLLENSNIEDDLKYFGLGLAYKSLDDFSNAEKYYLLAIEKGDVDALNNLALLYANQGREADAEKYYFLAIEKGSVSALYNLALLYYNQGREADAEKNYLLAIEKGSVESLYNLALLYQNQGKEANAEKYYLLAIEKGDVDALFNLALLYDNQGREADAEKNYLLAIEKGSVDALYNLALLYDNQGEETDAEKFYLFAIENGHVRALNNLALLYDNQGKEANAEKYFLLAIEKGDVDALNNLALLYANQGKETDAQKYYLLAIEKGSVDSLYNLALFYANQGKEGDAEKYYLLAIGNGEIKALNNLAILYANQGNEGDAEKYYLLAIEKGDVNAFNNLVLLFYSRNKKAEIIQLIQAPSSAMINQWMEINIEAASIIFLYIGDMMRFKSLSDKFMKGEKTISRLVLEMFLVHKQYNWVYKYFNAKADMIEAYKPMYYVTLHLLEDKEQEILRMPPEIQENVENILTKVKRLQEFYES
ncbi:MAG: tetratricopeptide repeat protein [Saprospiraceae bacterium]|nr:tetratricopeptide repeat protein [Saprospiraceae bacterium]